MAKSKRAAMILALTLILTGCGQAAPVNLPHMIKLSSSAFVNGGQIPSKYTCDGDNVSPPLEIYGVPKTAASLVLLVTDPDSSSGHFAHWVLFNIPSSTSYISEGTKPYGASEGKNSFETGKNEYGGPCPGYGSHRYFFDLYALDIKLSLSTGASRGDVESAMKGHILDQYQLIGTYQKK